MPRGVLGVLALAAAAVALVGQSASAPAGRGHARPSALGGSASGIGVAPSADASPDPAGGSPSSYVGALFPQGLDGPHSCTASVVDSPRGNVLVTAAHCLQGTAKDAVFAPGYSSAGATFGTWTVTAAYAPWSWLASQAPAADVAFLVVAPGAGGRTVQQVVGAARLGHRPAPGERVRVAGYLESSGPTDPVSCRASVYLDQGVPAFDCPGFAEGTSGTPWVLDGPGGPEVVGVIGGLEQGGCTDGTSYSAPFDASTRETFRRAVANAGGDVLPAAGATSC